MKKKRAVYLASGWFSPDQDRQLTKLEEVFDICVSARCLARGSGRCI